MERLLCERRYLGRLYVPNTDQIACADAITRTVDRARFSIGGSQTALYVLGPSYLGKSTAALQVAFQFYREARAEADLVVINGQTRLRHPDMHASFIPVIYAIVRPDTGRKAVVSHLVNFCGYGIAPTAQELTNDLMEYVSRHGIKLVILDEVHNLATDRKDAVKIYNTIKDLNTELGQQNVAFVYMGNRDPAGIGNLHANVQLNSRIIDFSMEPMGLDQDNLRSDVTVAWQEHLREWEDALRPVLPELEAGCLSSALGRILWRRTQGHVGALALLLKDAAVDTLRDPSPHRQLTITKAIAENTALPHRFVQQMRRPAA